MKAKEAPEKIYIHPDNDVMGEVLSQKVDKDIEYTRTDAFIEKAKEFIWSHTEGSDYHVNYVLKEFEKFMKGE